MNTFCLHSCLLCLLAIMLASCNPAPSPISTTPSLSEPLLSPGSPTGPPSPTASMPASPSPAATVAETPSPIPSPSPSPVPRSSVFVIAWDGGRADLVYDLMAQGELPHFTSLARQGLRAEWLQTIDPSLTAPVHSSLASGDFPSRTGIVSNAYHNPSDSFYWYRRGFDEPLDRSTPVWVTASRLGLTTATVFFPGASPAHVGQTADYTIGYGVRDAYSRQPTVRLSPAGTWQGAPPSYSPALEGSYTIPQVARLYLLVVDSTDDGVRNYDRVVFNSESVGPRQVLPGAPALSTGEWGSLVILPNLHAGANFLIQSISPSQVVFYHTGVYYNTAAPRSLLEALNARFGPFQPGGDAYALQHGWITESDYLYLLERSSLWMASVARWVFTSYQPDLLFTWQENFDSAGHTFFLTDPRQEGYTKEKAGTYAQYYRAAAQVSDRALMEMLAGVDLSQTTVLLVADHGMAPVHTNVYVNTLLEEAGLLTLDSKNYVVVNKTRAFAVASGGSVNIYINLEGHERNGIVPPTDYPAIQAQIIDLLAGLRDPETGQRVFQRVLPTNELDSLDLSHPNSGDVFAQAYPGYNLDGYRGVDELFRPAPFYGQHGYASDLAEMRALFIAGGAGIPQVVTGGDPEGQVISPLHITDLAVTIAHLLGFSLPASDGIPIPGLLYP